MNLRPPILALATILAIAPAAAQEPARSLPPVKAEAIRYVANCAHRVLPTQREVGEWIGQQNFSQVYDTRQRLMAELGRACQKSGIEQVQVVSRMPGPKPDLRVVVVDARQGNRAPRI